MKESIFVKLGLDDLSKISHKKEDKRKTLHEHITDIKRISQLLAKRYGLLEFLEDLNVLAEWHDVGKLNPKWDINNDKKIPHSPLSAYLYLKYSKNQNLRLFYFILKHHSFLDKIRYDIQNIRKNIIGRIKYNIDFKEALNLIRSGLKQLDQIINKDFKTNVIYADLIGIFKTADILSAMFEENNEVLKETINFDIKEIRNKIRKYVERKGLKFDEEKWKIFYNMAKIKNDVIFTAPTGWGKTFAALTAAANKKPCHIIYVLPTITSIRKMKKSILRLLDCKVEENYYFADTEKLATIKDQESNIDLDLFVSKSFISPVTITTLDQIVLSFLHVGKYFLKRFHFRNSVFVFDEFHLYPISGLYILLNFIKRFNEDFGYNIKSIFMSATVHPKLEEIITHYIDSKRFEFIEEYKKRRRYLYTIDNYDITDDNVLEKVVKKSKHGNILIICNTVEKAITTYLLLKHNYNVDKLLLLHSRFTYEDRRNKEKSLEKLSKSNKGFIFVSTQVAEVSLDMSFDYLFTEVAPIPSLIQRFGRVNRYSNFTDKINVNILYPKELSKSKFYPYDKKELILSRNIISELESNIKSEFELIEYFRNTQLQFDEKKLKEIDRYLDKWTNDTKYFFSVDLSDEELNSILEFRDTNTILIIPGCFMGDVLKILDSDKKHKLQEIKKYFTPIPIWWIFIDNLRYIKKERNLLFLLNPKFLYSSEIGYFDSEKLSEFLDKIDICKDDDDII